MNGYRWKSWKSVMLDLTWVTDFQGSYLTMRAVSRRLPKSEFDTHPSPEFLSSVAITQLLFLTYHFLWAASYTADSAVCSASDP